MKHLILALSVILFTFISSAQSVVINEFLASNNNNITDNYGEYEDWIEIYNPTSTAFNISGLYISDDLQNPLLFQIATGNDSTIIQPGDYIILWADKDPEQGVLHIDFKLSGSGEQIGLFDAMGNVIDSISFGSQNADISYGRSPDASNNWVYFSETTPGYSNITYYLTPSMVAVNFPNTANNIVNISVFANVSWDVSSPVSWLSVSPTSGTNDGNFTLTVTEANTTTNNRTATISLNSSSVSTQEILVTQFGVSSIPNLIINEFMANNNNIIADNFGEYEDWIEIYNYGSSAINIGGLYITDNLTNPTKFQISDIYPDSTLIAGGGFLLLWVDDDTEQGILHTNFKLSNNGEQIGLFVDEFTPIDTITYNEQFADTSYGRTWDGGNVWTFFTVPTPGYSNSLDINDVTESPITIYPNPTTDFLMVSTNDNKSKLITIFDSRGRLAYSQKTKNQNIEINTKKFDIGIYYLQVLLSGKKYSNTFLIISDF